MELSVELPGKSYDLLIEKNGLDKIGEWVSRLWSSQKIVIITDETVNALYGDKVAKSIEAAGFDVSLIAVKPGEASKSLPQAEELYNFLANEGMTRNDGVVVLGGGVIGDLGGFVASTYMRGIHFLQVPTTLLAQVDSSIGGKTAVNTSVAKNLVGTFTQPDGVLIDPNTLLTLEDRRIREGLAEIVKYAAIADIELWEMLDTLENEKDALNHAEEIIYACCNVKRKVVVEDELDVGLRLILNFGHTIGHSIEQTKGYGVVTHGEAVSIGMCQMTKNAELKGTMPIGILDQLKQMLEKFGLPVDLDEWDEASMYQALTHDKKTRGKNIKIILLEELGKAKIETIPIEEMKDYLKK